MLRENSRGVVYHNPLFSGMNKGDSAKPGFGFRQLLRRYKKATFLVATISFAIVFVVLPHLSLGGDSFHESGFPLTTTKLLLLVFTGVFQHYLVLFLLFAPGDNVSRALRQCNKLLLFVFVVWVSFGPGEQLTGDLNRSRSEHKALLDDHSHALKSNAETLSKFSRAKKELESVENAFVKLRTEHHLARRELDEHKTNNTMLKKGMTTLKQNQANVLKDLVAVEERHQQHKKALKVNTRIWSKRSAARCQKNRRRQPRKWPWKALFEGTGHCTKKS